MITAVVTLGGNKKCGWKLTHHSHLTFPLTEEEKYKQTLRWDIQYFTFLHSNTLATYVQNYWQCADKFKHQTSCHVVALFSSNINELNQQTVRSTTGPLSEGTHTFHIRTHLLKVVKTSLNNLFDWTKTSTQSRKKRRWVQLQKNIPNKWMWSDRVDTLVHDFSLQCSKATLCTALI